MHPIHAKMEGPAPVEQAVTVALVLNNGLEKTVMNVGIKIKILFFLIYIFIQLQLLQENHIFLQVTTERFIESLGALCCSHVQ